MKIGQQFKSVVINHQARSLYSLIADAKYRATSLGRNSWKKLIGSRASLQPNCNKEGFNVLCTYSNHSKARIGIVANNQNVCKAATPESGLALEGFSMTPTRVVTKLLMVEIMATSTSKRWDTSWSNKRPSNPTNKLLIVIENRFKSYSIKGFVKMRWNKILYWKGFSLLFWLKKYLLRPKTWSGHEGL